MEAALPGDGDGDGDGENGQTGHQGRSLPEVPGSLELGGTGRESPHAGVQVPAGQDAGLPGGWGASVPTQVAASPAHPAPGLSETQTRGPASRWCIELQAQGSDHPGPPRALCRPLQPPTWAPSPFPSPPRLTSPIGLAASIQASDPDPGHRDPPAEPPVGQQCRTQAAPTPATARSDDRVRRVQLSPWTSHPARALRATRATAATENHRSPQRSGRGRGGGSRSSPVQLGDPECLPLLAEQPHGPAPLTSSGAQAQPRGVQP